LDIIEGQETRKVALWCAVSPGQHTFSSLALAAITNADLATTDFYLFPNTNLLMMITLSAWQMTGWKTKINNILLQWNMSFREMMKCISVAEDYVAK